MTRWKRGSKINEKRRSISCKTRGGSKRTCDKQSVSNLWCLPNEILVYILRGLHIKDILNLKPVHPRFCDLVDNHASVWSTVSFTNSWPCKATLKYYERAANHGNVEANIKLGVAYLYNEGLPGDFEGKKITVNGEKAAEMFCQAEERLSGIVPFTFLFIRPPWSSRGACCKEYVFNNMVHYTRKHPVAAIHQCIGRTLSLCEEDNGRIGDMTYHLKMASELGSSHAKYVLWQQKFRDNKYLSKRQEVDELSSFARNGSSLGAKLELCQTYSCGNYGSSSQADAAAFVRKFIASSTLTSVNKMFTFQELSQSMRYILLDWLVEVANMKDYCSLTLHLAIYAVDRFLKKQKTTRGHLQLLGVSSMVLCSRFLGKDIITIREAAWLTDNTYNYEEVVRMMGEITATLRGNFRVLTCLDLVQILNMCGDFADSRGTKRDRTCALLSEYFCELTLLQSEFGEYQQGLLAASCTLLARTVQKKEHVWMKRLEEFSGFSCDDLKLCVMHIHKKCFNEPVMKDHRRVQLEAVKHRYGDEDFMCVSSIQILDQSELHNVLGIKEEPQKSPVIPVISKHASSQTSTTSVKNPAHSTEEIINSPSRPSPYKHRNESLLSTLREESATPTIEKKLLNVSLNDSMTGYLGDKEDEGELHHIEDYYDSDMDLENLWRLDSPKQSKDEGQDGDESDMNEKSDEDNIKKDYDIQQCLTETTMPEPIISPIKDLLLPQHLSEKDGDFNPNNDENYEDAPLNLSMMSDVLDLCGEDRVFERKNNSVSVFRERSNSLNEAALCGNLARQDVSPFRRRSSTLNECPLRKPNEAGVCSVTDFTENGRKRRGSFSLDSYSAPQLTSAWNPARKSHYETMSSPPPPTQINESASGFNRSPFGGMSLFKVDTPNTAKYTHSGIKIDFSDQRKSIEIAQKCPASARINNYIADQTVSKASVKLTKTQKTKVSKSDCSNETENSLKKDPKFHIYKDYKTTETTNAGTNKIRSNRRVLKEVNSNIDSTLRKPPKKRKPTAALGNEKKIQVISDN